MFLFKYPSKICKLAKVNMFKQSLLPRSPSSLHCGVRSEIGIYYISVFQAHQTNGRVTEL